MRRSLGVAALVGAATLAIEIPAGAAEGAARPASPQREEIEAWLDSNSVQADVAQARDPEEGLPPAPRHHGWLLESGLGALGHIGELRHVSPLSPRFHLRGGYEFTRWLLAFAEGDVSFGNTAYAPEPPQPRGYALYGAGLGLRFTVGLRDWLGAHFQGSFGIMRVDEDVLATYGYTDTTELSRYFGGMLGVQFYLPSPHLRLLLEGGIRHSPAMDRTASTVTPLAWMVGPAIGYAF